MEKVIKINAGNAKYISELKEFELGLPHGVVNKQKCDAGATWLCANCDYNYIIVVPYLSLIDSICEDQNNTKNIFPVYSDIKEDDFIKYVHKNTGYYKIVTTYDSLYKLGKWIDNIRIDRKIFKLLIDEYHLLLQQIQFREKAINNLFSEIKKYNHYTFLTATPIQSDFSIKDLEVLPHYEIIFEDLVKIKPKLIETNNVIGTLTEFLSKFLSKGTVGINFKGEEENIKEVFIFLNSVKSIKEVCDKLELTQKMVKICCANEKINRNTLEGYKINKITEPNKKINFFTSRNFEGANLFSKSGLIIVVSDSNKDNTLIDISTSLQQIAGRIRNNKTYENSFKNTIVHIYNTNNRIMNDDEFKKYMEDKKFKANILIEGNNKLSSIEKKVYGEYLNLSSALVTLTEDDNVEYSEIKEKFFEYKQQLKKEYSNGVLIREKYKGKFDIDKINKLSELDIQLIESSTNSFHRLCDLYYSMNEEDREKYFSNSELKILLKNFTREEVCSAKYKKDYLENMIKDDKVMNKIFEEVYVEGFISCKELKEKFKTLFNKYKIKSSPKASLIEECKLYKAEYKIKNVNGKTVKGYILSK